MVDYYGRWKPETDYANLPEEEMCDCDYIAKAIMDDGYIPKTSIEQVVHMVVLHFDCCDNYGEYDEETGCGGFGEEFTVEMCLEYVKASGGWQEFDYDC